MYSFALRFLKTIEINLSMKCKKSNIKIIEGT